MVEAMAAKFRREGACAAWLSSTDSQIAQVFFASRK